MARLKQFHFQWCDAWHRIDDGYDTILETTESGEIRLKCLVNLEPQDIVLTDCEDDFIRSIENCGIKTWNNKSFDNSWVLDGTMWFLDIAYDNEVIRATGMNGYPKEFEQFINTLRKKWGLRKAHIAEEMNSWIKSALKDTEINEMTEYEKSMPSYL